MERPRPPRAEAMPPEIAPPSAATPASAHHDPLASSVTSFCEEAGAALQQHQQQQQHSSRPSFPLLAIVFAEFDNTVGPRITCQAPEGFLSESLFEAISDFIITGSELCHKLVSVSAGPYQVIGYPMQLSHAKYHRNALLFNVAFVFPRDLGHHPKTASETARASTATLTHAATYSASAQLRPYHPVIRKLAMMMESLELESEFLFRRADPAVKRQLQSVVSRIFRSLNTYGECSVAVETLAEQERGRSYLAATDAFSSPPPPPPPANKISLKLYPLLALPPRHIPAYSVPVRVKDLDARWKAEWDLTLRQVVPFMDGVNYVARISTLSGVHPALVAKCIRQLLYYEAVVLLDIFQFSNVYAPCERLREAAIAPLDASLGDRTRVVKLRADARRSCRADPARPKPSFSTLYRMWCALSPAVCIGDFYRNLASVLPDHAHHRHQLPTLETLNIHPRRFVQFALLNGFIRRVHAYPILVNAYAYSSSAATAGEWASGGGGSGIPTAPSLLRDLGGYEATLVGLIHSRTPHVVDELLTTRHSHTHMHGAHAHSASSAKLRPSASVGMMMASAAGPAAALGRSRQATDEMDRASTPVLGQHPGPPTAPPLGTPPATPSASASASGPPAPGLGLSSFRQYERYLDGEHHFDHLSVLLQRSFHQLDDEIRRTRRCIVVYK